MDIVCTRQYDNAVPVELCEELIKMFEENPELQRDGTIGYGDGKDMINKSAKDSKEIEIMHTPKFRHLGDQILEIINEKLHDTFKYLGEYMRDQVGISEDDLDRMMRYTFNPTIAIYALSIQKVKPGTEYKWHQDSLPLDVRWNIILYLNTVKEGGGTIFANGLKIQPKQGTLVFFPTTWTNFHKGEYIDDNTNKYILTGHVFRSECNVDANPEDDPILKH